MSELTCTSRAKKDSYPARLRQRKGVSRTQLKLALAGPTQKGSLCLLMETIVEKKEALRLHDKSNARTGWHFSTSRTRWRIRRPLICRKIRRWTNTSNRLTERIMTLSNGRWTPRSNSWEKTFMSHSAWEQELIRSLHSHCSKKKPRSTITVNELSSDMNECHETITIKSRKMT